MSLKRIPFLFLIILASMSIQAQKQANYWYFGRNAGLSFAMGAPIALTDGSLNTGEGCSSISTPSGALQFYTDGRFVYNKEHDEMPHGNGLYGHSSSTQSGIIVPKPASTTQYYIFTVDAYDNNLVNGLCYSRVDMTLDNGLGDVVTTEKNVSLLPYACEKVTAVGHGDGISIWVITHQWGSAAFYAYKVTTTGVDLTPVISVAGEPLVGDMQASKGYIKVSPDGGKIAMANNTAFEVGIFNFNNNTGVVTHIVTDNNYINPGGSDPGGPYGVEFSPNSQLLYVGEWKANRRINQYNVTTSDPQTILNSKAIVATVGQDADPIGALQLGPDNRLYIARQNSPYLSRINFPNTQGGGCGFVDNAVNLSGRESSYGLPPFIQSFFYLSADYYWDMPACDGTPVHFYTSASDTPDSVKWNFGDPASGPDNTSTLLNPTHLYPGPGQYWVTLSVYLYGVAKNAFHIVSVFTPPEEVHLGNDTSLCAYEPFYLDAGPGFDAYLWQDGDTNQSIECEASGLYWCQVFGDGGCSNVDSINVTIHPVPDVYAGDDQVIANGTSTTIEGTLSGGSGDYSIQWTPANLLVNPNVIQPLTVNMTGTTMFTLTVTDNAGGCISTDHVLITVLGGALAAFPAADPPEICFGEDSQLEALASGGSGNYDYEWTSTPAGFNSTLPNPVVNPLVTTTYHLKLFDGYSEVNENLVLPVHDLPEPNAGPSQTIPYGTFTTLNGSATGGSGNYSYHWEPASKLANANVQNPTTVLLDQTTLFTLTVTDTETGCVSDEPGEMTVIVTGNALNVNPDAQPDTICAGQQVQLYSLAGGGSGTYEYYWTSVPQGFYSTDENPVVQPQVNTTYSVSLTDGYTYVSGNITVIVDPAPVINLGPDGTVCVFDTVVLDAGNPGASYIWSDGSTDRSIKVATTGIGFDLKTITVTVTTPEGCVSTDQRTIIFDFAACNAIDEQSASSGFRIYPNPGNGTLNILNESGIKHCELTITDIYGRKIIDKQEMEFSDQNNTISLNLDAYPPGLYLVTISEDSQTIATVKYLLR